MSYLRGRQERKHPINVADLLELRAKLPFVATPDQNMIDGKGYRVRSLYFDNYRDKALREKIDGVNNREKFRIRLYNNSTDFIRLEKKSKRNGLCYKQSAVISASECERLLRQDYAVLKENGHPLMMELYAKIQYQQLRPKNIVDYMREAYVYAPGNVRITLDYDIRASLNPSEFLSGKIITAPIADQMILEVKYDEFLPEVIRGIVSLQNRSCTAFSKYAAARLI